MPTYTGTNAAETISGSAGDDLIDGLRGDDTLFGLEGQDVFTYRTGMGFASAGDGDGADVIDGGADADHVNVFGDILQTFRSQTGITALPSYTLTAAGADALFTIDQTFDPYGSAPPVPATRVVTTRGVESISFNFTHSPPLPTQTVQGVSETSYSTDDVLTIGNLSGTSLTGQIDFDGGDGNDTLNASAAINRIVALGDVGADILTTGSGNDDLSGGAGNDILIGGAGDNVLSGGSGVDTVNYSAAGQAVHVDLNDGVASSNGMGGVDTLSGIENLFGTAFNDVLIGEASNNRLIGGLGSDYLIGLDGNDYLDGGTGAANALQGGMGDDTYIVSAVGDTVTEFAGQGIDEVQTALSTLTLAANVERLRYTGSGAFTGHGNATANIIVGGDLVDSLYGEAGDDSLYGGLGSDQFYGGAGNDYFDGGTGSSNTANYSLAAAGTYVNLTNQQASNDGDGGVDTFVNIQVVVGSAFNDVLIGDSLGNILTGGLGTDVLVGLAGNDILVGGTGAANQMQGGLGDDTYRVSVAGDSLIENANEGVDTVETTVQTYTLKTNFENLRFTGVGSFTGTGNSADNFIVGGLSNDVIYGLAGNDILSGNDGEDMLFGAEGNDNITGGAGNDTLVGADGDDILRGGEGADVMIGGAGNDSFDGEGAQFDVVLDIADYSAGTSGLTLRVNGTNNDGQGGVDTLVNMEGLIGTAFNDTLIGDQASNFLSGGLGTDLLLGQAGDDILIGGSGLANQMQGGTGDDRFVVSVAGDSLVEFAGEGTDTVETTLSAYTLKTNFEGLTYTGAGSFTGTGSSDNNTITGGTGADTLLGMGGNDTLVGGAGAANQLRGGLGDDRYLVSVAGDVLVELAGEGTDTVQTTLSTYTLQANIENLLNGSASSTFTGTGNGLDNAMTGSGGADTLIGLGGNDTLTGAGGFDTAVFSGLMGEYTVQAVNGHYVVTDTVAGRDGVDTLFGIEQIRFGNGDVLDLTAPAAPAFIPEALLEAPRGPMAPVDDVFLTVHDPAAAWNGF
ncbi:Ca2+-binding RTX toxin-like protein [Brevundimonas alba]|uniref:Ca2+-binding RTX toxin-like protein n=1 Tax=Brevundimonas alba TaxID=74314 RepID=A0A7X6BPY5_9CAUL|nr:calcium-binding protein [Brevundimonas alba]NJC42275.1 Ca2+-binding RTX toxin-like protein [Brevundimonas alba]